MCDDNRNMLYSHKAFLAPDDPESNAFVNVTLERYTFRRYTEAEDTEPCDEIASFWTGVNIADCSRVVSLDFDCHTQDEVRKKVAKLDKLLIPLNNLREELLAHMHELPKTRK